MLGLLGEAVSPGDPGRDRDVVPVRRPGARLRAILYWAVNLGFAVGSALGGRDVEVTAGTCSSSATRPTTLAYAAIVWLRIPETRPREAGAREVPAVLVAAARSAVSSPSARLFSACIWGSSSTRRS